LRVLQSGQVGVLHSKAPELQGNPPWKAVFPLKIPVEYSAMVVQVLAADGVAWIEERAIWELFI
jgi:hypothetical protein